MHGHEQIYHLARCYDVAFGFRNVDAECDTLTALVARHAQRPLASVLELAAGPARHAREFARRGVSATALDASPAMCNYARHCAHRGGVTLATVCADMVDFAHPQRFDLALLAMDSISYLLDNDTVLRHLNCVAAHLLPGGLHVLEVSHPRDAFGVGTTNRSDWTSEADGLWVRMQWGAKGDAFDPVTQIDEVTVTMSWRETGAPGGVAGGVEGGAAPAATQGELVERARQRRFTANELDALVRASGCFDIVEWLGALAPALPFSNDAKALRMVAVLRRRDVPAQCAGVG